ncbi:MAG: repeat protein, partial [Oscillospiraceae bacterium]|nr:repeat protein [Oscillospiraceae bacterium]
VIKGISEHHFEQFEPIYLEGLRSKSGNLRIACVKALGDIAKTKYEQQLITASHDIEWSVRSAAVQALSKIPTPNSMDAVAKATQDKEWWVRYNAAKTLVEMPDGLEYAEKIFNGYDKYAAEVVKYVLYRRNEINN